MPSISFTDCAVASTMPPVTAVALLAASESGAGMGASVRGLAFREGEIDRVNDGNDVRGPPSPSRRTQRGIPRQRER